MALEIRRAERAKSKLRVGLSGPSGAGKTYSALLIARGLASSWDKVLLIDTENGSGELYSDLGPYNVLNLIDPYAPEKYIEAIKAGEKAGMEVIIIDSVSHEWDGKGGCLQINEILANSKFKGNTWAAWSETTPRHQKFLDAITSSDCHVITSARSKTDTIQTEDKKIKKVGLKDIQRDGFEYELTVAFNIDRDKHMAMASKDRTTLFIDRDPFVLDQEVGKELLAWSQSGRDVPKPRTVFDVTMERIEAMKSIGDLADAMAKIGDVKNVTEDERDKLKAAIKVRMEKLAHPSVPIDPAFAGAREAATEALSGMDEEETVIHDEGGEEEVTGDNK